MKVLILAGWLAGGGAERVVVHLLNGREEVGADVELGLLRRDGAYIGDIDPAQVRYRSWGERLFPSDGSNDSFYRPDRLLRAFVTGPLVYRSLIRDVKPDVIMSVGRGPNYLTWLALAGMAKTRPAWIVRDGNNLTANTTGETDAAVRRNIGVGLLGRVYRSADCLLTNSDGLADDFHGIFSIDRDRVAVVENPIDLERIRKAAEEELPHPIDEPFVFTAGRLNRQKGHDVLLRAFAGSAHRDTHRLVIAGEGEEEQALRDLAAELGIVDRVQFAGFQKNPWAWMRRCDLFVLPSRWEGCPNALGEALACGAPALSTDCRFGPSELITHGEDGWLVEPDDPKAFGEAMDKLLGDAKLRKSLGRNAAKAMDRYALKAILPRYGKLFAEVAKRRERDRAAAGRPAQAIEAAE